MSAVVYTLDGQQWEIDLDEESLLTKLHRIPANESGKWIRFEVGFELPARVVYLRRDKIVAVEFI